MSRSRGLAALVVLYLLIAHVIPVPESITPQGWRQTAIFICVIAGMVTEPIHASALVLVGLTAMAANGTTDARGPRRLCRAFGLAGARRDADREDDARLRPGPPHRAAVRPRGRQDLAWRRLRAADDRRHPGVGRALDHRAQRGHGAADRTQHRGVVRLASQHRVTAPAGRVPGGGDVPRLGGGVRDVHHRPGEQSARRQPRPQAGQRRSHRAKLVRGGDRPRPALVPGGAVDHLPGVASGSHLHARGPDLRAR